MEAVARGSQMLSSISTISQIQDSLHTSLKSPGGQNVKWAPSQLLSFSNSSLASVGMLPTAKKTSPPQRGGRKSSRSRTVVSMKKKEENKTWRGREDGVPGEEENFMSGLSKAVYCTLAAGVVLFHPGLPAWADEVTVTFPGSKIGEVNTVQRTLVEAWGIIRETYVDPSFNNQDWDKILQDTLADTLSLTSSEDAYSKIRTMLASLGDPFTRIITPMEYENFRIGNDGALEGVGLLIASERDTGRLIVMSPIEGGPAARAGIIPGDELVEIDNELLTGLKSEDVATKLRGRAGTSVTLVLRRSVTEVGAPNGEPIEFKLERETITLSPVYSTVLTHSTPDGRSMKTGYIRLSAFSQNAATDMERAIASLESEDVGSYILDLRNNPGGLVKAGLDVAQMWLDGNDVLVNTVDREGDTQPIVLVNGHALTQDPLVVLVNEGSASASEILAGALHDNGRAVLIGTNTYGKGKIQSVTELKDGSALFVTVAKYLSPDLHQIDRVGIAPDLKCSPEELTKDPQDESNSTMEMRDSCILVAERELDKSISS